MRTPISHLPVLAASLAALAGVARGQAPAAEAPPARPPAEAAPQPAADDWRAAEAPVLSGHVQLTSSRRFSKAGEAYFNADGSWVIFQAIPVPPEGQAPEKFYQMYAAEVARDAGGNVTGLREPVRLSAAGSANTCGWFHPTRPGLVLFGSTTTPPAMDDVPGYQRTTGRYVWQFHKEMRLVATEIASGRMVDDKGQPTELEISGHVSPQPIFPAETYTAEASWSPDGRFILYAQFDRERSERLGRNHLDIKVVDSTTGAHTTLVTADGYNGGPFFSPDGRSICYRSDRTGDGKLQIFVARLAFGEGGAITGVEREFALTANEHVNWAPFWHPSGRFLVYATSAQGHSNYEVHAVAVDFAALEAGAAPATIPAARVTSAAGADVLPAFSPDGRWMMWTAQRGRAPEGERPPSQLWVARFNPDALRLGSN